MLSQMTAQLVPEHAGWMMLLVQIVEALLELCLLSLQE